jgi:hypothetical protein
MPLNCFKSIYITILNFLYYLIVTNKIPIKNHVVSVIKLNKYFQKHIIILVLFILYCIKPRDIILDKEFTVFGNLCF